MREQSEYPNSSFLSFFYNIIAKDVKYGNIQRDLVYGITILYCDLQELKRTGAPKESEMTKRNNSGMLNLEVT